MVVMLVAPEVLPVGGTCNKKIKEISGSIAWRVLAVGVLLIDKWK